ncbi:ABC transporter substrate-binding protein [Hahella aquimaris]|uniref:ABC transporter substrate-binding protein n=1 Tax=Hahella sp. HNIBRBA332 TaxID=3015983 RepID=UPI00273AEB64|nr:ABC transporter substrate-binding protein [Hahella sp. HNIBRBA332]WLQ11646.1 ABC transporter substrate-binding protein [Hahella sp. HNIBRBA332]
MANSRLGFFRIDSLIQAFLLFAVISVAPAQAASGPLPVVLYPAQQKPVSVLNIHAVLDYVVMNPIIKAFQQRYPNVEIRLIEFETADLFQHTVEGSTHTTEPPDAIVGDLLISSAMDLQVKLVNDGYAQRYESPYTRRIPDWAKWRNEAFGFTFEPVVTVVNTKLLPGAPPQDRQQLLELIRSQGESLAGKIATYDIARSGVGYLFAAQDSQQATTYGRLLEAFGTHSVQLACCTGDILDGLASGQYAIGYNLLGSYTKARLASAPNLQMILPADYTLIMTRIALIHKHAVNTQNARDFLDFLLSPAGQQTLASESKLYPIDPGVHGEVTADWLNKHAPGPLKPITVGPQLLVPLDKLKRQRFLSEWRRSLERETKQ